MRSESRIDGIARFLYTQNPFYLISAGLVLYGLRGAYSSSELLPQSAWLLAGALCGYTLLVSGTAFLVVRLGKVWQDARSLFVILVLMFFALSVSFDEICNQRPATAATVLPLGWLFSVLVTEALIGALHLKFPGGYRLPFYLVFVLFFLYPIWVSPAISELSAQAVAGRIYLFPILCGGAFLSLIPAIRRGSAALAGNGTPWRWPWYPWTLFAFLALAVCIRSYLLTLSFQPAFGYQSSFGLYYLTPFFFVILVLLLEIGVVEKMAGLLRLVVAAAPLLVLSAIPLGGGDPFEIFLANLATSFGSPIWMATLCLAFFYAYALHRGVRLAEIGVAGALLAASIVSRSATGLDTSIDPEWWPLAVLAGWQLERAWMRRTAARWFAAATCLILTAAVAGRDSWFVSNWGAIPLHLWATTTLLIGYVFSDRFAIYLRCFAVAVIVAACLAATGTPGLDSEVRFGYVSLLASAAGVIWLCTRKRWWLIVTLASVTCVTVTSAAWLQSGLAAVVGWQAIVPLSWGLRCFVLALVISALKGGLWHEIQQELRRLARADHRGNVWI